MKTLWVSALGMVGALGATPAMAVRDTPLYTSITVFGDSLVDAGNLFIADGGTRPDPALGYFDHHFTNGYDYPDLISLVLFGVPTTPSLAGGNNYAFGGARIVDTGDSIPDFNAQIAMFENSGKAIDPNGLYIVNLGGNDIFGAEGEFGPNNTIGDSPDVSSYLVKAAQQYVAGIQTLNDLGARNILFTDFPNAIDPLTTEANNDLNTALASLMPDADTSIFFYSLSDFNVRVLTNSTAYGFPGPLRSDVNCVDAHLQSTGCKGIFSFDGVHVTAAVQAAGFRDMNQQFGLTTVQAVPEPAAWVMMIAGVGVVGGALRRRQRSAASVRVIFSTL